VWSIRRETVQLVSLISPLKNWFRPSPKSGVPNPVMSSTLNRYSRWRIKGSEVGPTLQVVSESNAKVVCLVYELDDAESIVQTHNKLVTAREEWYGA
jgi:hypothetical protein